MIQGARGWCTGMTQRDGMGREVGEEFRMGNTCTPVADSCQCMAKPLQYCKVKNNLKKNRGKLSLLFIYLTSIGGILFYVKAWLNLLKKAKMYKDIGVIPTVQC